MDGLKNLVKELEKRTNDENLGKDEKEKILIGLLQSIGKEILNKYVLKIGDIIIEPLRVEAYYYPYKDKESFDDPCVHKSEKKLNKFGELYFIEERYGYPGIDLCLSLGDYYLSFLIKNSRIGDTHYKQMDLYDRFESERTEIEKLPVLNQIENNNKPVFKTARVNIPSSKTKFAKELLALFIELDNTNNYDFEKGFGKEKAVAQYIFDNKIEPTLDNIENVIGYKGTKIKEYVEKLKNGEEI